MWGQEGQTLSFLPIKNNYKQFYSIGISRVLLLIQKPSFLYFDFGHYFAKKNLLLLSLLYKVDWFHQFQINIDIIPVDQPGKTFRFTVIYNFLSLLYNSRYQLVTQTHELLGIETLTALYASSNWSEREMWDIFGIIAYNHPDLRRLLTDYGFSWFPLRKDFPVSGYKEVFYSEIVKRIVYKKVEFAQAMRIYTFISVWKHLTNKR